MKNTFLHELNFRTLLGYPEAFQPQHRYDNPIDNLNRCDRFCTECERGGASVGGKLTLMSHGCDTEDFETILGPRVNKGDDINTAIMFLLEDPGGDYELGEDRTYGEIVKKPPVKHYYWSPSLTSWPQSIDDVKKDGNYYGSYFAYLMQEHSLANVYITNLVKCKRVGVKNPWLVEETCVQHFLKKEIKEFSPSVIFCFGRKTFYAAKYRFPDQHCVYLRHPAFRGNRSQFFSENDKWMRGALVQLSSPSPQPSE